MLIAGVVGAIAIVLLAISRFVHFKQGKTRPPVWLNVAQIRSARDKGWAGISDELDGLLHQQYLERMTKRESFWARVSERERESRGQPGPR